MRIVKLPRAATERFSEERRLISRKVIYEAESERFRD